MQITADLQKMYADEYQSMIISSTRVDEAMTIAKRLASNKDRYQAVSDRTNGVPWYFIAVLHEREASGRFDRYLGDGEPLSRETQDTPAGRGPFKSFEDGAVDAIVYEGFDKIGSWSIGELLFHCEQFNGFGYKNKGVPSPYVWSWSDKYSHGKYDSDGHYNPSLVDAQCGCAVMISALGKLGFIDLEKGQKNMTIPTTQAPVPIQVIPKAPIATAGVNVATSSVVSHLLGSFMSVAVTVGAPLLALIEGTTLGHWLTGALFGIAGAGALAANVYQMVTNNKAASNNTLAVIQGISDDASQLLAATEAAKGQSAAQIIASTIAQTL